MPVLRACRRVERNMTPYSIKGALARSGDRPVAPIRGHDRGVRQVDMTFMAWATGVLQSRGQRHVSPPLTGEAARTPRRCDRSPSATRWREAGVLSRRASRWHVEPHLVRAHIARQPLGHCNTWTPGLSLEHGGGHVPHTPVMS